MGINVKERFVNGELDLSGCGLKDLPMKEILALKNVTGVNLSRNKLTHVAKGLSTLSHLQRLDLSGNALKGLPDSFGILSKLKHLNLADNEFTAVPPAVVNMKALKYLNMKGNPLSHKHANIVGSCSNDEQCAQAAQAVLLAKNMKQLLPSLDEKKKGQNNGDQKKKTAVGSKGKKTQKGFIRRVCNFIASVVRRLIKITIIAAIALYCLSYYDVKRYDKAMNVIVPVWGKIVKTLASDERTAYINASLSRYGKVMDETIVIVATNLQTRVRELYAFVTKDETIQSYVEAAKNVTAEAYGKVRAFWAK